VLIMNDLAGCHVPLQRSWSLNSLARIPFTPGTFSPAFFLLPESKINSCPAQVHALSLRKQRRLGSLPALIAMIFQKTDRKKELSYLYSNDDSRN
jgi:hypothetical protein